MAKTRVQRLTLDDLSGIPSRNSTLFLSDYLQEQHSHAKEYASAGLITFSSWIHTESPPPKVTLAEASIALDEFLLGTPVLKARAPAAHAIERPSPILTALEFTGDPTPMSDDQASRKSTRNTTRTRKLGLNTSTAQDNSAEGNVDKKNSFGPKGKPKENKKRSEDERGGSDEHLKRLSRLFLF
jgi:hypothetical protein